MAETVTTVAMDITANTDDATKGLSKLKNSLNGVIAPLKKTTSGMKSLTDRLNGLKQNLLASKNALKDFIKNSSKLSDFTTKFLKSIKRIALYRTVRFLLSTFVNMVKEGMDNIYKYSSLIGGRLAKDMDSLATGFLYAKNSIATFTSQLLSALTPALLKIADVIAQIFTYLAKLVAVAMGKHTFTEATKSVKKYGDEAKKTQLVLAGFDELNVLSAGGSSNTADVGSMFKETEIDSEEFKKLQDTLNVLEGIVKAIGIAFGTWKLADILTKVGLLDGGFLGLIATLGKFIVKNAPLVLAITGIVTAIAYLWKTNDEFRDSCIKAWKDIKQAFQPVLEAFNNLLKTTWESLKPVIQEIGNLVAKLVQALAPALQVIGNLMATIIKAITPLISGIVNIVAKIETALLSVLSKLITLITGSLTKAITNIGDKATTVVNKIINVVKYLPDTIKTVMNSIIRWVEKAVNNIATKFNNTGLIRGINQILGTNISLPTISISRLATGGVLEDGLFTMNRGEIAGKFDNGTSVVANNEQIIEGIKRGVMEAMAQSKQNVTFVVEGDPQGMFKVMRKEANNYRTQTGKFAF